MTLRTMLVFLVTAFAIALAENSRAGNRVANGDFDNGTASWLFSNPGGASWNVSDGIASITRAASGSWVRIYQDITGLTPGKSYRLVWKAKVGSGGSGANAQPHYYWHLTDGSWNLYQPPGIQTTDWSVEEVLVTMPSNADKLRIGLRLEGQNTSAACDGMFVAEDLLGNGTFQNGLASWTSQATSPNSIAVVGAEPNEELQVHREDNSWMRLYQDVTVKSGHRYLLSGSARSDGMMKPWVFYYYYDSIANQWHEPITVSIVGTSDSPIFQECIEIPPAMVSGGTTQIRIDLSSHASVDTGDVYFSDVSLLDLGDHSNSLSIPTVGSAVSVDGLLSDAFWASGTVTMQDTFRSTDFPGLQSNQATTVKAGIQNDMLYLSFDNAEPNVAGMTAQQTEDGWAALDDHVTVYLVYKSSDLVEDISPTRYASFSVNSKGAKHATILGQSSDYNQAWYTHNPTIEPYQWQAAAAVDAGNQKWTAEMAIPLASLASSTNPINVDGLAINIVRYRPQSKTPTTSWAMVAGEDQADISQFSRVALENWTPPTASAPVLSMAQPLEMPEYLLTGKPLDFKVANELLAEGRFADGLAGWTTSTAPGTTAQANQGIARIESNIASSVASLSYTCALPTYSGSSLSPPSYTLRYKVWRNNTSGTVRVGYLWGGSGQSVLYVNVAPNLSGQWQTVEQVITAPAADTASLTLLLECTGAVGTVARFKEISLSPSLASTTFEGITTPPADWTTSLGSDTGSTIGVNQGVLELYRQDTNSAQNTRLYKDFYVKPNTWYTVRTTLKISGPGGAQVYYYTSPAQIAWTYAGNLIASTSTDWETRQATFQTGSDTKRVRLSVGPTNVNGTTVFVEDICFEEATPIPTTLNFSLGAGVTVDSTATTGTRALLGAGLTDSTGIASSNPLTLDCSLWTTVPTAISNRLTNDQLDLLNHRADAFYLGIGRAIDVQGNLVSSDKITVMSKTNDGILRGLARLAVLASQAHSKWPTVLPAMDIIDAPRLDYRSILLSANSPSTTGGFVEPQSESDRLYLLGFNAALLGVDGWSTPAVFPYASPAGVGSTATVKSQWSGYANYNRDRGLQFVPSHFAWHSVAYLTSALPGSNYPYLQYAVDPTTLYSTRRPNSSTWKNLNVWHTEAVTTAKGFMDELATTLNPKAIHIGQDETHFDQMIPAGDTTHTKADYVHDGITIARDHLAGLTNPVKTHLWGDMLDPGQNGKHLEYSGTQLLAELPSDVVIYDWKYDEDAYQPSAKMFVDAGFKTVGSSWYKPLSVAGNIRSVYVSTLGGGMAPSNSTEHGYCMTSWGSTSSSAIAPELVTSMGLGAYLSWSAEESALAYLPFPPGILHHYTATNYTGDDGVAHRYGQEYPFAQSSTSVASPTGLTAESALVSALDMPGGAKIDCLMNPIVTARGVELIPFQSNGRPAAVASNTSPPTISLPTGTKASHITFLHTVNRQPEQASMSDNNVAYNNVSPGKYQLIFTEGTLEVELKFRDHISDWNSNDLPRHAELGLFGIAGDAYQVNIQTLTWKNPNPTWTLTGIKVLPGDRTAPTQVLINDQNVDVPAMHLYLLGVSID